MGRGAGQAAVRADPAAGAAAADHRGDVELAPWRPGFHGERLARQVSRRQKKVRINPIDVIPGVPPATLNPTYSPRTVQEPSFTCTPTPAARRESVFSLTNTLQPGFAGVQVRVVTVRSRLSRRATPALAYRSSSGSGRYSIANAAAPFIDRSVGQPPTIPFGCPKSR